jgi:hypothetical protein
MSRSILSFLIFLALCTSTVFSSSDPSITGFSSDFFGGAVLSPGVEHGADYSFITPVLINLPATVCVNDFTVMAPVPKYENTAYWQKYKSKGLEIDWDVTGRAMAEGIAHRLQVYGFTHPGLKVVANPAGDGGCDFTLEGRITKLERAHGPWRMGLQNATMSYEIKLLDAGRKNIIYGMAHTEGTMGLNLAHPGFWKIIEEFAERFSENWLPRYIVPRQTAVTAAAADAAASAPAEPAPPVEKKY